MMYSYDVRLAKERIEKSALAILDLLTISFNESHEDIVKLLRGELLVSIYEYEKTIDAQMEAYEILRSLHTYAGWNNDNHTLNKEQRKKMKFLLDLLEPDEKCSANVDFEKWMERVKSASDAKGERHV